MLGHALKLGQRISAAVARSSGADCQAVLSGAASSLGPTWAVATLGHRLGGWRGFSSEGQPDYQEKVDEINEKFVEARDEIEMTREDAETVYFNESYEEADKLVKETMGLWYGLLDSIEDEDEKGRLMRSMGMKMEQLKAEFAELKELHD